MKPLDAGEVAGGVLGVASPCRRCPCAARSAASFAARSLRILRELAIDELADLRVVVDAGRRRGPLPVPEPEPGGGSDGSAGCGERHGEHGNRDADSRNESTHELS